MCIPASLEVLGKEDCSIGNFRLREKLWQGERRTHLLTKVNSIDLPLNSKRILKTVGILSQHNQCMRDHKNREGDKWEDITKKTGWIMGVGAHISLPLVHLHLWVVTVKNIPKPCVLGPMDESLGIHFLVFRRNIPVVPPSIHKMWPSFQRYNAYHSQIPVYHRNRYQSRLTWASLEPWVCAWAYNNAEKISLLEHTSTHYRPLLEQSTVPWSAGHVGGMVHKVLQSIHGDFIVIKIDASEMGALDQGRQKDTEVRVIHPTVF